MRRTLTRLPGGGLALRGAGCPAVAGTALALMVLLLPAPAPPRAAEPARREATPPWPGEEMPLPLPVRTPADLAVKAIAERQYLVFNLIASGKLAWDRGDFPTAASKWESLLRLPGLDREIDRVIRPLAMEARGRAGGQGSLPPAPPATATAAAAAPGTAAAGEAGAGSPAARDTAERVTVSGVVSGGGTLGPGGTVVWLKRTDGATPRPTPSRTRTMKQVNKTFVPRVLPVTVGTRVDFTNQDAIFHNVFSPSRTSEFDAGLYRSGKSYQRTFDTPGPVQILCNIHASMVGYVVVVNTPYFAQADGSGAFSVRGVPPGDYTLEAWHESSSKVSRTRVTVPLTGVQRLAVKVAGDRHAPTHVPDKYGKPRQAQLGY